MDQNPYSKKSTLIKAQQNPGKEPSIPHTQDIIRMSRSTAYLALHQTIYSSLQPFTNYFDIHPEKKEDTKKAPSQAASHLPGGGPLFDSTFILQKGEAHLVDEPSRKLFLSHYRRFSDYLVGQMTSPGNFFSRGEGVDEFSQEHQYGFHTHQVPSRGNGENSSSPHADPFRQSLQGIFRRILSPWLERQALGEDGPSPPFARETGVYGYLSTLPDHPWTSPRPVTLLSGYEEIEETRLDEQQIRYLLKPYNKKLEAIEVIFDQARNIFTVKGQGFTKGNRDGSKISPQVMVNPENGSETRIYQINSQQGFSLMEIENFDTAGNLLMKSIERTFDRGSTSLIEMLYQERRLTESALEVKLAGNISIKRNFIFSFSRKDEHRGTVEEHSQIALASLRRVEDLGLRDLREAFLIQQFCHLKPLDVEIFAHWEAIGKNRAELVKRRLNIALPGSLTATMEETLGVEYRLKSQIKGAKGEVLFLRNHSFDARRRMLVFSVIDSELNVKWEQRNIFDRDGTPLSIHCVTRDPIEWNARKSFGDSPLSVEKRITHLLPGMVVYAYDSSFDTLTHKETTRFLYHFDKLLGTEWIKPSEIKKADGGEIMVTYTYEAPSVPSVIIEEQRCYVKKEDFIYETASTVRTKAPKEGQYEERSVRRDLERGDETLEITRTGQESQYQETTNIKEDQIDRFIRSRKKTDKVPLNFFPEPNRWLDQMPSQTPGIESHVSTYVHEMINTSSHPQERHIRVREETYETEHAIEQKRDIINFLAFLDDEGNTHYRIGATV